VKASAQTDKNPIHCTCLATNQKTKCVHKNFFISSKSESQMEAQRPCIPASQKTRWKYKSLEGAAIHILIYKHVAN
jgi:hypothetical protein